MRTWSGPVGVKRGGALHIVHRRLGEREHGLRVLVLAAAILCLLALTVAPALAAPVRQQTSTFNGSDSDAGAFSALQRVAIHQATGTVYAIDSGRKVVDKFDASGAAQDFSALSSSSLAGSAVTAPDGPVTLDLGDDSDLAVDNSGTATDGRLYVLEEYGAHPATAFAFDADGTYIRKITVAGGDTCGIAVDSGGHVWIADYNSSSVIEYDASGVATGTTIDTSGQGNPCHIAFDSSDNLYVALYFGALQKYNSSGAFQGQIDAAWTRAVAVDPTTDHVFAVHANQVSEYDSAGAPFLTFGPGKLSGATGIAVRGSTGEAYVSDATDKTVHVFGAAVTLANATTGAVTGLTTSSATLHGTVNPEGATVTDCHFQYGTTTAYGHSVPCVETTSDIGTGTASVSVHADVTGLNASTDYHFRLVAVNAGGTSNGADAAFSTTGPPTITGGSFSGLSQSTVTVAAQVNPRGGSTTYHVEYVDDAHFQQDGFASAATLSTPESDPIGSDSSVHAVNQTISGLEGYTTYHVRVVATSTAGRTNGTARTLTTASIPGPLGLPDGRAYELVSPVDKGPGGYVGGISLINSNVSYQAARSGQGFAFELANGLPDATAGGPIAYRANRGSAGWSSTQITPPALIPPFQQGNFSQTGISLYNAPDLSCSLVASYEPLTSDMPQAMIDAGMPVLYRLRADGTATLLTPQVPTNLASQLSALLPRTYIVQGVSADCDHVVFQSPFTYPGVGASGLYEWSNGKVRNVGVRPNGTVVSGASAGYEEGNVGSVWNAVSSDGSRIFFSAPASVGGVSGKSELFLRQDGQSTIDVSQSQTATVNRGAVYQLASKTGDHVIFLANYGLTSTSSAGPKTADCTQTTNVAKPQTACDLYDYDVQSGHLTDLSADTNPADTNGATVAGVLGASDDASYVYFAAQGQLVSGKGSTYATNVTEKTYNVYLAHGGTFAFVGVLNQNDLTKFPSGALISNSATAASQWRSRVTPDGRHLLFSSTANVTGYDNGGVPEAYRYSADSDATVCVSCRPDGRPSVGTSTGGNGGYPLPSGKGNWLNPPVTLTDDGSRIFFTMPDVLAAGAVSGNANVYEWHDGQISLLATDIAPSISPDPIAGGLVLIGASASGDDVFVITGKHLVPEDTDLRYDLYDIRVDGGFPAPPAPPAPCDPVANNACPGPLVAPPGLPSLGSVAFSGPGNVPAPPAPLPKPEAKRLKVTKPKAARGTSTRIKVKVPEKGKIRTSGSGLRRSTRTVKKAGTYRVLVKLSSRAKRTLQRKHRVKVRVTVRFTPARGKQQRTRVHVTFRSKAAKKRRSRATTRAAASLRRTTASVDAHGKVR